MESKDRSLKFEPLPGFSLDIIRAGGLISYTKELLKNKKKVGD